MKKAAAPSILCAVMLLAIPVIAEAQQPAKIPRIGYLPGNYRADPGPNVEAFRHGLKDLGYIEGQNILLEYRYSDGKNERMPSLVAELVKLKVDVLVSGVGPAIRAAQQATKTIPIVIVAAGDPVATGYVDSLARPDGISPGSRDSQGS
jgi:ABC-type uncharacterized transport system substrate-binding protein